ncbi:macrophage mannose receptor 1-like isoform X1 [Oncorhynchus keta]|uniref:macrophage mannose receptor 1-like isoform X1 n=1 Tax=Oncorhynchus keta TaxID=8018 RepID=UPI00227C90DB|nr:macrophage mannose receptor 1-like isoform X1 [Oncorhynchus keta]
MNRDSTELHQVQEVCYVMDKKVLVLFLSGLYTLSSCLAHEYHFVNMNKTWTEAQRFCREKYTDLATIENMEDMKRLINTVDSGYNGSAWIGLQKGEWQWSLADRDYSQGYVNWEATEPNNAGGKEDCVFMRRSGQWNDAPCNFQHFFICNGMNNSKESFHFINEAKTWHEAQSYCRKYYTDLASVRNQTQNHEVVTVAAANEGWIGLFRDSWKWSAGSNSSFTYWINEKPNNSKGNQDCASTRLNNLGRWDDMQCYINSPFICYGAPVKTQQVVRVKLTPKDQNMDLTDPAIQEAILQQFVFQIRKELREKGISDDVKLRWKEQTDGKIFHKEEKKN